MAADNRQQATSRRAVHHVTTAKPVCFCFDSTTLQPVQPTEGTSTGMLFGDPKPNGPNPNDPNPNDLLYQPTSLVVPRNEELRAWNDGIKATLQPSWIALPLSSSLRLV